MTTLIAIVIAALPLILLRGSTLRSCWIWMGGATAASWLLLHRLGLEPVLLLVSIATLNVAIFAMHVAAGRELRWSATRAALVALLLYSLVVASMIRAPIDGDEPFYLLVTESLARDFDLDLANQYRELDTSAAKRTDLVPQYGDPVGPNGERYSRHEPFLSLLMLPGYLAGRLPGAVLTIVLFGALLVRSTIRWMEDEGVEDAAIRAVYPFFAFGPPVLFYATRIWPEVPAAFFFVEALRGVRQARPARWLVPLAGLVLLKLRFVLVGVPIVLFALWQMWRRGELRSRRAQAIALGAGALVLLPLAVMFGVAGDATGVHALTGSVPGSLSRVPRALFGLLADGMSGMAFQAPFYLCGIFALSRWRNAPRGFRLGTVVSLPYLVFLLPREEWFGGWAPPLRYVVFLMPVLALGAASFWQRLSKGAVGIVALWTMGLVIHGVSRPWQLFHIFNGENTLGEALSRVHGADFSRLFPSFIRLNEAAWPGAVAVLLIAIVVIGRRGSLEPQLRRALDAAIVASFALLVAIGARSALRPASVVEFEDAHVSHEGGRLSPDYYASFRTQIPGGWILEQGDSMSFLAREGEWTLRYVTGLGARFELDGTPYDVDAAEGYRELQLRVRESGRVTMRCLSGAINVDRMVRR